MKRIHYFLFALLSILFLSCGKQDAVYKEFVKPGGYIYPAKPLNLTATSGYQRIFLEWEAPMDPSIRTTKLFWDNYTDSLVFSSLIAANTSSASREWTSQVGRISVLPERARPKEA